MAPPSRFRLEYTALILAAALPFSAQAEPVSTQLPTGGQVVAGQATISQSGASMNVTQTTDRAAIDWQSFDIGSAAHVNFDQPSVNSVALNRVTGGSPSQIFGSLTANGKVYLTNAAGIYFAPGASVNVGGLIATTHSIGNEDFMAGRDKFARNGAEGSVVNQGKLTAALGGYIALLAPEVRNEGVIVAQMGTVVLAAGETYELSFGGQGGLADVTVTPSTIKALVENKQLIQAPGGLVIMSAQAANALQSGVVRNSGTIEASGMVDNGGVVRLVASDEVDLGGTVKADAAEDSNGAGGTVTAIASLDNRDSIMTFSGSVSARGGKTGGDGGSVETSGSHVKLAETAQVDTSAVAGKTGTWLIDPYDYTIDGTAASVIGTALDTSNVTVTTATDVSNYGSSGNSGGAGNIAVNSGISSSSTNLLTLTADNGIAVNSAISVGALTMTAPGGITLSNNLSTVNAMTLNGNVTLGADVTLTSGVSTTYASYTVYTVPTGVTSLTATLVGGAGGKGGNDGTNTGGAAGSVGSVTATFNVSTGELVYIAPGSGGAAGGNSVANSGGGAGGTNYFGLASGGTGGNAGPNGTSGGGGGGGAATIVTLTASPTTSSAMLVAGGGGGGGGSGNNTACPGLCAGQGSNSYRTDSVMTGQTGYNAGNQASPIDDGGASGGGGGGVSGGLSNQSIFFVNEWTGRGGNVGSSGAANGFTTTSLSTSLVTRSNSASGSVIISYGGGTIAINGTVDGAHALNVVARSSDVSITGAVGGTNALTSLNVTGAGGIALSGGHVTTTGSQTYTGPVTLGANDNSFATTSNGAVTFAGNIVKGSGVDGNLNVSAGSGAVSFNGQTGSDGTPIGSASVSTTGTTSIAGALYAASLAKTGNGTTTVSGGTVKTANGQSYAGTLDLGGATTLTNTGTGNVTLSGSVSNSTQSNLTIVNSGGDVSILGNLAYGTNARPTSIGDVSVTASGNVTMGSSGSPISADAKSLSVTAHDATVYANSTTSFTCGTGSSAYGVCLTGGASFDVSAASTFSGPLSGTASLTKSGAGSLTMTGRNTYSGSTTVNGGKIDISGTGSLGGGSYAGTIAVNGQTSQIRFSTSANQILTGSVSGTGFINSPGTGSLDITTLSHASYYNLAVVYVVPTGSGSSSVYGSTPTFSYQLATTANGGTLVTDANASGTAAFSGKPTATSAVGNYSVLYTGGLTLGNEMYGTILAGTALSWTVTPRPLTVTVSKTYDGSALFSSGFVLSGTVNGDSLPTLTGVASVVSATGGTYSSFASSTLSLNNANYTLTGATVNASIMAHVLNVTVTKTYDASSTFGSGFVFSGMIDGDAAPTVSGTASVSDAQPGLYTRFASNNLVLSDANYTLVGGTVSATISPQPPSTSTTITPPQVQPPEVSPNPTNLPDYSGYGPQSGSGGSAGIGPNTGLSAGGGNQTQNSLSSGAPSAAFTPATTSQSGGTSSFAGNDVVVSLVRAPSTDINGAVSVSVPNEVVTHGEGFSFALPDRVSGLETSAVSIKTLGGTDLPGWLSFNADTHTFYASAVPAGGLPLRLVVSVNGVSTTMEISAMP